MKNLSHRNNQENKKLLDRYVLPTYVRFPVTLVHGEGIFVWDADGKRYLDFFGGLAVDNLGHAHKKIVAAIATQAKSLIHCSNVFYIQEQGELAKLLAEKSGLYQAFFCNSGAEANEAAIKFARYFSLTGKNESRFEILVAENSFHGRTLGALSATMQPKYQAGFGPLVPGFKSVPFNNIEALVSAINSNTAAIFLEPIQGEGGVNIPDSSYLPKIRKLCDEKGILLILDEVQTGMGRTGKLFAYQHAGIKPDILTLSKALGSGVPIGACLVSEKIAAVVKPGIHASTFGGNALVCRAALATLGIIATSSFLKKVETVGNYFKSELKNLAKQNPLITDVRGVGLILACQLSKNVGRDVVVACIEKGLLINSIQGNILRFVPPLILTKVQVDRGVKILSKVLTQMA